MKDEYLYPSNKMPKVGQFERLTGVTYAHIEYCDRVAYLVADKVGGCWAGICVVNPMWHTLEFLFSDLVKWNCVGRSVWFEWMAKDKLPPAEEKALDIVHALARKEK